MGTQFLTHQMVAREAAAMLNEENFVGAQINTDREEEFGDVTQGYKNGDTVRIKVPPVPIVFDGATFAAGGSAPSLAEGVVSLQVNKQKHVALSFTAKEKKLDMSEFKPRYLRPAINSLIAIVNADLLLDMKNQAQNAVQLTATPRTIYRNASSVLDRFLAPVDQRRIHITSDANDLLGEQNATLFVPGTEISEEFEKNRIGKFSTLDFYVNQSLPVHANGAGAGYVMNGAGVEGASQLAVITGTGAIAKGTILTVANVLSVHPLTGLSNGKSRQYTVTADYAGGAGNIQIAPPLLATTATKIGNINALPANAAAVTLLANAAGKASNIAFHRNAMAAAFPPLGVLASCEGYTATVKNISVRVMTFGDGKADVENTRVDVLYGDIAVRPDHMCRVIDA
jgi:P22 coat protein - gene protein 5